MSIKNEIVPPRTLTLVVAVADRGVLDKIYKSYMRGFHGSLNDNGYAITFIGEGDQTKDLCDEDE